MPEKYVVWMDRERSKGMVARDVDKVPGREERRKKADEWRAMLKGEPVSSPKEKTVVVGFGVGDERKAKRREAAVGMKSVAVQDERRRIRRDRHNPQVSYLCSRCELLVIGSERQALQHWLSKCVKQLSKMQPPQAPLGGFPPTTTPHPTHPCRSNSATQETLVHHHPTGIDVLSQTGSRLTHQALEDCDDFKVNYFMEVESVCSDFVVRQFDGYEGEEETLESRLYLDKEDDRMGLLCDELQRADKDLKNAFERLEILEIKLQRANQTLNKVGRGYLSRRVLLFNPAVSTLQRFGRGMRCRCRHRVVLPVKISCLAHQALKILQKTGRIYLNKKVLSTATPHLPTIITIQRAFRRHLAAKKVLSVVKGYTSRLHTAALLISTVRCLQRVGRASMSNFTLCHVALTPPSVLQRVGKAYLTRLYTAEKYVVKRMMMEEEEAAKMASCGDMEEDDESGADEPVVKPVKKKVRKVVKKIVRRKVKPS